MKIAERSSASGARLSLYIPQTDASLQLDYAAPSGDRHRLCPIVSAKFFHDVLHMGLDGFLCYEEPRRYLPIAVSRSDLPQHLHLTLTQIFVAQMLSKAGGNLGGNTLFTRMDLPDRIEELLRRHALQQVSPRTRFECALHLYIALERRKDDNSGIGKLRPNGDHHVDATEIRHPKIDQGNVRSYGPKSLNPFPAASGHRSERHVYLAGDDAGDTFPD